MGNYLFNQQSLDTARLLGETGGVDHDEATIVTDIDNYGETSLGRDGLNVALGNDGTLTGDTVRAQVNIKLKNLIKYLAQKLNSRYLQLTADPLSEIKGATLAAKARENLNVPSLTDLDTLVTAAVAADTTTLKTASRLHELSLEVIGQGIEDVYENLNIQSKDQQHQDTLATCDTKAQVTAKIVADTTHFKSNWTDWNDMFSELDDVYKKQGARKRLDVYNKQQTKDEIEILCYTKSATASLIKAGVRKRYHAVENYGADTAGTSVVIDAYTYNYWAILTNSTTNDWVKLPSISDSPNLLAGDEVTVKAVSTSEHALYLSNANTDMQGSYIELFARYCVHFTWNGTLWELNNSNAL
jgi:hypothetical protein